jgi:hypothetical protein
MALSSQNSLQVTIRQLKEIIAGLKGEEHESCRLAGQMEMLAAEIEKKSGFVFVDASSSVAAVASPQVATQAVT